MKKTILIVLVVVAGVLFAANAVQKIYTGTTTDSWVATRISVADWEDYVVAINNTGASETMSYKIDGYIVYGGTAYDALIDSTTLAVSTSVVPLKISNTAYGEIRVSVISLSGATTYSIEATKK